MQGKFRVILRNGIDIITTMIVQNTIFTTYFFRMDSLMAGHFPLETQKKNLLNRLAGNSAGQIQSYPSKWV